MSAIASALQEAPQPKAIAQRLTALSHHLQIFRMQVSGSDSLKARVIAEALDLLFDIVHGAGLPP